MNVKLLKWNKHVKIIAPNMGQQWTMHNTPLDVLCSIAVSVHVTFHEILPQCLDVGMPFAQAVQVISALNIVQIAERILPNEIDFHLKFAFEKIAMILLKSLPSLPSLPKKCKDKSNLLSFVIHQSINL